MFSLIKKDNLGLLTLLIFSVLCIYVIPILKTPFLLTTLVLFFFSKRDHLWICFLFIFMQNPGFLFLYRQGWIFELTRTVGVPYEFMFALAALAKMLFKHSKYNYSYFSKAPILIFVYMMVLTVVSFVLGMNTKSIYIFSMFLMAQTLFISLPQLLRDENSLTNFTKLAYFAMLVLSILQIIDTLLPVKFFQILGVRFSADELSTIGTNYMMDLRESSDVVRVLYGPHLSLFCLASALHHLLDRRQTIYSRNSLSLVIFVSIVSVFMTATRGWIIAYGFLLLVMVLISNIGTTKAIITGALLISMLLAISPLLRKQTGLVFQRVATVNEYLEGDKTAGGTMQRLTVRAPRVYNKFKESPIVGLAYSSEGVEYNDGHVGNYNILLEGGWVGAILYALTLLLLIIKLYSPVTRGIISHKQYIVLISVIGVMVIIHSSSAQFFGYMLYDERNLLLVLLMLFVSRSIFRISADGGNKYVHSSD